MTAAGPVAFLASGSPVMGAGILDQVSGAANQGVQQVVAFAYPLITSVVSDRHLKTDVVPVRWER